MYVNGEQTTVQVVPVYSPTGEIESFRPDTTADSDRLEELTGATIMSSEEAGETEETTPTNDTESPDEVTDTAAALPTNPDEMLQAGYIETTHPSAAAHGHRTFVDPDTGETIRFDEGEEGASGHAANDHYHIYNPDSTGKHDKYLDQFGNPTADGSNASHIYPDN